MSRSDLYHQLVSHVEVWGLGALTREERLFVRKYRQQHRLEKLLVDIRS